MNSLLPSSGSYGPDDVSFLLTFLNEAYLGQFEDAEGEIVEREKPPDALYLQLFHSALKKYAGRVAHDIAVLAHLLRSRASDEHLAIVSLARAGTPLGVVLVRALRLIGLDATHYSVGLCPAYGVDARALGYVLRHFRAEQVIFFDGWTAKGTVSASLRDSVIAYNKRCKVALPTRLYCLSDLAGVSAGCAGTEDYLIPSALLNATGCGLISRTFTSTKVSPPCWLEEHHELKEVMGFHYSFFYQSLAPDDLSLIFVDAVSKLLVAALEAVTHLSTESNLEAATAFKQTSEQLLAYLKQKYGYAANLVKPGITEASRAILRRKCSVLLLNNRHNPDVAHLLTIAEASNIKVVVDQELGCQAVILLT